MSFTQNILKHPKPFYNIFMLEIWERFGYTSVISILAVFFVKQVGLSEHSAFILFGAYSALVYAFMSLGGYIGDNILGAKRTIILGLITLLCGYILLGVGNVNHVYIAMSLVCVGTGLFKANPSSLLSRCYDQKNPEMLHNAFTMFYMAINIGSVFGLFFSPIISVKYGFQYSFVMSAIGIILALTSFTLMRSTLKGLHTAAGARPLNILNLVVTIIGVIVLVLITAELLKEVFYAQIFLWSILAAVTIIFLSIALKQDTFKKNRMFLALILMYEAVSFNVLYAQMQTSINFFAINNVHDSLLGFHITPQSFQSLNPFWIVILSPLLSHFYMKLKENNITFSIYNKFATGMVLCSASFIILYCSKFFADTQGLVSSWWIVLSYLFQSTGELMISALGLAMVAELVPRSISGFVMGMWFVFMSIGSLIGGYVATLVALPSDLTDKLTTIHIYTDTFLKIGLVAFFMSILMFLTSRFKSKLIGTQKAK